MSNEKQLAISEFDRLMKVNHEVSNTMEVLPSLFDIGYERGSLMKLYKDDYHDYYVKSKVAFDLEKLITSLIDKMSAKRVSNNRDMIYNGPEITLNEILVCDFKVQETLDILKDHDSDYMYFERDRYDLDAFLEQLKGEYDVESREYTIKEYNTRELYVLLMKLYQVGFDQGYNSTKEIPSRIKDLFEYSKEIDNFNKNIDDSEFTNYGSKKLQIKGIIDANDLKFKTEMVELFKRQYPDWESYEKYFN